MDNENMDNLLNAIGCENCGGEVVGTNKWGMKHCGEKACVASLAKVGKSQESAAWFRGVNDVNGKINRGGVSKRQ